LRSRGDVFHGANGRGEDQGQMKVIQAAVDSGKIKIVGSQWVPEWSPTTAMSIMENALTAANNKIDAVVASNDGTAGGAIQALAAQNLAGKVPISGQDADLAAVNQIIDVRNSNLGAISGTQRRVLICDG
jgi:ABC-type xylose transport system substrate-binding protein